MVCKLDHVPFSYLAVKLAKQKLMALKWLTIAQLFYNVTDFVSLTDNKIPMVSKIKGTMIKNPEYVFLISIFVHIPIFR